MQAEEFKPKEEETYEVAVHCSNCGSGRYGVIKKVKIPLGTAVVEFFYQQQCKHCGCYDYMEVNI